MKPTRSLSSYGELMTVCEAAEYLGRNQQVVRRWCAADRIPAVKVGRSWYIPRDALAAHLRVPLTA